MKKIQLAVAAVAVIITCATTAFVNNKPGKWVTIFNGKDFKGWHAYNKTEPVSDKWQIEDGAMVLTGKGGGDLVTDKEYENFEFELDWKISEKGNSGVMWGVIEDKKFCCPYSTGPEMQVLDDQGHPDAKAGKDGNHKAGSLYDMIPPASFDIVKPAGEWNTAKMRIDHKANKGTFWLNGKQTLQFDLTGPGWDNMVAGSKFKTWEGFGKYAKGKIALQDHGNKVWFKNIKIREI